jgi:DNA-binding XRE family transcriptional regulator
MITKEQCRAARAFLDWSQGDLAKRADLSLPSICAFERGQTKPEVATLNRIKEVLVAQGIEFLGNQGIQKVETPIYYFEGDGWISKLLDDVIHTLKNYEGSKDLLILQADDSKTPPEIRQKIDMIESMGAKVLTLIEEGSQNIKGDPESYRYIPKEYFLNFFCFIYGNNYAICDEIRHKATVHHDVNLAESQRRIFAWLWSVAKPFNRE